MRSTGILSQTVVLKPDYFPPSGRRAVTWVSQVWISVLPTNAGGTYTLTLWLSHDGGAGNNFYIFWDGTFIDGFLESGSFPYMQLEYDGLVASADGTELTFSFLQVPAYWHLDDIVVVPSP